MATQTKADRQAAAKKAAATRQRNEAASALDQATTRAKGAVTGIGNAGKLVGVAGLQAAKSVASRVTAAGRR
jgi:hypothetical protein